MEEKWKIDSGIFLVSALFDSRLKIQKREDSQ